LRVQADAPGRINLIGEHTDYNRGWVLPIGIAMGISLTAALRRDNLVKVYARDLKKEAVFSLSELSPGNGHNWWDYLAGVCWALLDEGFELSGADISFGGDIPIGAGLSSSAALEVAAAAALVRLNSLDIDKKKLALLCQKAENRYVGVQCGVMDQYASMLCKRNHALLIDCRSLDYEHVPLKLSQQALAIIDSRVNRSLAGSDYNRRREECREALALINEHSGVKRQSLREVTLQDVEQARFFLPEELYLRSLFVVEENQRVPAMVRALQAGDLAGAGRLMNESHTGLRDLYKVSCRELDLLAELSRGTPGVWGARLTGAGFGGCIIALVQKENLPDLQRRIMEETSGLLEKEPCFYTTSAAGGCVVKIIT